MAKVMTDKKTRPVRPARGKRFPVPLGNTAQFAIGASWKICALISSLFLAIHKVLLRKSAIIRTQIFSGFTLAELCGIALVFCVYIMIHFMKSVSLQK